MKKLLPFIILFVAFGNASAAVSDFGFEQNQATIGTRIFLDRAGNGFELSSNSARPASWGEFSLSPFSDTAHATPYILNFGLPVTGFSCDMGDSSNDVDSLSMKAYSGPNGTGILLASTSDVLQPSPIGQFTSKRLSLQAAGIKSIVIIGGSPTMLHSVYYDNFTIITKPVPSSFGEDGPEWGFSDFTVFRPSNGVWYSWMLLLPQDNYSYEAFGLNGDKPASGDYDGKGWSDIAVFRNGTWYIKSNETNTITSVQFGLIGDIPTPADYDGDGKTDMAVFRPSNGTWYIWKSSDNQYLIAQFGLDGDVPLPNYYDGDGKADVAVFRPSSGVWYYLRSSDGDFRASAFGQNGDKPVPADYDGDGRADLAIYRAGVWWIQNSSNGAVRAQQFGLASDIPVPAEYARFDKGSVADGKADLAVFRPSTGTWYILPDGMFFAANWGSSGDIPISLIPN
jgi:hypothetical protein